MPDINEPTEAEIDALITELRGKTFSRWESDVQAVVDHEDPLASKAADYLELILAARRVSSAPSFADVRVKPLRWDDKGYAVSAGGEYSVEHLEGGWVFEHELSAYQGSFGTEGEAKAAAQADYERRIRSALDIVPAPSFADGIEAAAKRIEAEGAKYLPGGLMDMKRICHDLASDVRALAHNLQANSRPTHRHKKRGTEYVLIGYGRMQSENWIDKRTGKSIDMEEVAMYRSVDDGSLWPRPREEFEDGRFEVLK